MEKENLQIIYEVLQNSSHVAKLLTSSEIAMNDGEVETCQKLTKEAQLTLKTMANDCFEEFVEYAETKEETGTNDYDLPTPLELIKQLNGLNYNLSVLLGLDLDGQSGTITNSVKKQITQDINTINEIYNAIYNN